MNPTLLRVTNRIIERSKETRSAYLARIEQAKTDTVHRHSWPAVTWPTALPPASRMTKPR
jgi:hypothetical protein